MVVPAYRALGKRGSRTVTRTPHISKLKMSVSTTPRYDSLTREDS